VNLEQIARETPIADLPKLAGLLAEAQAIVLARIVTEKTGASGAPVSEPDEWITAADVAVLLKVAPDAVRRMAALRPYRSTALGPKTIRYRKAGVLRLLKRA